MLEEWGRRTARRRAGAGVLAPRGQWNGRVRCDYDGENDLRAPSRSRTGFRRRVCVGHHGERGNLSRRGRQRLRVTWASGEDHDPRLPGRPRSAEAGARRLSTATASMLRSGIGEIPGRTETTCLSGGLDRGRSCRRGGVFEDCRCPERAWSLLEEKAADEAELLSLARVELALFVERFESRDHGDHQRGDRSGRIDSSVALAASPANAGMATRTRTLACRAAAGGSPRDDLGAECVIPCRGAPAGSAHQGKGPRQARPTTSGDRRT